MCLVALQDEGLTVFPTHRLIRDTTPQTQEALGSTLRELFTVEEIDQADLRPPDGEGPLTMGYIDSPLQARLPPDAQGPGERGRGAATTCPRPTAASTPPCSRRSCSRGRSASARTTSPTSTASATAAPTTRRSSSCSSGEYDAAFFLRSTPIEQVRAIAAAGVNMPPKSTYFFPKVPTGLLFNPLL